MEQLNLRANFSSFQPNHSMMDFPLIYPPPHRSIHFQKPHTNMQHLKFTT